MDAVEAHEHEEVVLDGREEVDETPLMRFRGRKDSSTHKGRGWLPRMVRRSNGRSLLQHSGIKFSYLRFFTDGFTTLLNTNWILLLLAFSGIYIASWVLFGCFWTVLEAVGGFNDTCLVNVRDFSGAFLFSIESQTTIGYGSKFIASDCHVGIFLLILQTIVGLLLDSLLIGLIFSKLVRPRSRRETIIFSKVAVVHDEEGYEGGGGEGKLGGEEKRRVLQFQVGDPRHTSLVESHVRLQLYWNKPTKFGQQELKQYDLDVGYDLGRDRVFLLAPVLVTHVINESSPLYGITAMQMQEMDLEIVVILEGIVEATGLTAQALWSYTGEEILFNKRFVNLTYRRSDSKWKVDFSRLSDTTEVIQENQL